MTSEFDLIRRFFTRPAASALLGVGDDAALVVPSPGMALAVSADMLVEGRHFSPSDGPGTVGHKALAVNLSDMAAMGAQPRWALLSLALPEADEAWLSGFAGGFFGLAEKFGVELIGGDTTRGPRNISLQMLGEVPPGAALRRDGARAGDEIWVSGTLGAAAAALAFRQGWLDLDPLEAAACLPALHVPQPRVALGLALRGVASAAIDVSDGLLADLGHILERSGVGAEIHLDALPLKPFLAARLALAEVRHCALCGGDDYELCFTASPGCHGEITALAATLGLPLTPIGTIRAQAGLTLFADGRAEAVATRGFDHFDAPKNLD